MQCRGRLSLTAETIVGYQPSSSGRKQNPQANWALRVFGQGRRVLVAL
jgi:hypothetical protein